MEEFGKDAFRVGRTSDKMGGTKGALRALTLETAVLQERVPPHGKDSGAVMPHPLIASLLDTPLGRTALQFGKFGAVGVVGLVVDVLVVSLCVRAIDLDVYSSRLVSYLCAATTTWALNRVFTFRDAARDGVLRQWATFLAANAVGGLVNYGVYSGLVASTALFHAWPEAATAAGSLAGMFFNFAASKKFVFKAS